MGRALRYNSHGLPVDERKCVVKCELIPVSVNGQYDHRDVEFGAAWAVEWHLKAGGWEYFGADDICSGT